VRIGAGVEIGANSCVDRAKFDATVVGDGTKLDNLVQIGHNCRIGRCVVMAAGVAVGGSTVVGDGVQIGGGTNLSDHLTIGARARLAGGSSYITDVPAGEDWGGTPGQPIKDYFRMTAAMRRIPDLLKKAKKLGLLAD
jgi:UDP-3-O-[3-hydroxymyristoyl] glucosamine N-acyltransferase